VPPTAAPTPAPTAAPPAPPPPASPPPARHIRAHGAPSQRGTLWLAAVAAAVIVVLVGSAIAVWRVTRPGTTPAALGASTPAAGASAPASPAAPASAAASAGDQPRADRSGAIGSKVAIGGSDPTRVLIDADDFSAPRPDPAKWGLYDSAAPNGSVWSPAAVRTAGGELQITGTGTNPTGAGNMAGGLCWCGTNGDRLYGIWQVRAKFDAGAGYGPIIGLTPKSGKAEDGYISAVNMPDPTRTSLVGRVVWAAGGTDASPATGDFTAWHTYTVEWRAGYVRLSIDGKRYYDSTRSAGKPVIPQTPMHLYIQVAVGPGGGVPAPDATTPAHVVAHFDWVRFYR
jgi:beta-glucanase (GH16 family)